MNISQSIIEDAIKKENDYFEKYIRENATPKIKGEITQGKLKWRGIKVCVSTSISNGYLKWITQRGVQISPKIIISFKLN
jgi:hypothetical protein